MALQTVMYGERTGAVSARTSARPCVRGKFLYVGGQKLFIKGVTYGAFRPDQSGLEFNDLDMIDRDFAMMARHGINTVRIPHTTPPVHLLDAADRHGLRVMVGLSAEQYVGYLLDDRKPPDLDFTIRSKVRTCAGHPALLCYSLGNEIPSGLARWLGRARIENYLREINDAVREEDPDGLITYVNYPTTEYLDLPFLDFLAFNVYLERQDRLAAYLARLQNIAGDRPLVMSELGFDSLRHGTVTQAEVLDWQVRTTFRSGCAGAVIFSWTDEWFRGGADVNDWEFGLTDRARGPKPALSAIRNAFDDCPCLQTENPPLISVVVCTHNGSRTIGECLDYLSRLKYPNYEVIVVDDGSTDHTADIARSYNVRLIQAANSGLSSARNTGYQNAHGEIIAYIDDDAYPDPDWLNYYCDAFQRTEHVLIGGPNLPPENDAAIAQCVARSPGGPNHVLLSDTIAEHVPGCNMAFRKDCLESIGGFDPVFQVAGDDVDACWRVQEQGWTIGFAPAAVVWHHRRASIRAYWKQQLGYGRAESLLQRKWPRRFKASNHLSWMGRIYLAGVNSMPQRPVVYHGIWGGAPFQGIYQRGPNSWTRFSETPGWYLINAALVVVLALGFLWPPLLYASLLLLLFVTWSVLRAFASARQARFKRVRYPWTLTRLRAVTALLWVTQPVARFWGRIEKGLTPWKTRGRHGIVFPCRRQRAVWTEQWIDPFVRLANLEKQLSEDGLIVCRGNAFEAWDLQGAAGALGAARLLMAVEDHGAGTQYVRLSVWPRYSQVGLTIGCLIAILATVAGVRGAYVPSGALCLVVLWVLGRATSEAGRAIASVLAVGCSEAQCSQKGWRYKNA